ncbi:MAG: hypothetical protein OXD01_07880 [Gammaproteobacteria bacterium]|nr:hypothetical protein [Gammaproteobacteria bacterium]
MAFSRRESIMLVLAVLVLAVFVVNQLVPAAQRLYASREQAVEDVLLAITREEKLIEDALLWYNRRLDAQIRQADMESLTFIGDTVPVIEASIQRDLTRHARETGLTVNSTGLAEQLESDEWLLISQEMSFLTTDPANIIVFLERLEHSVPRLRVKDFSLDRSRNQFGGDITVVGFARATNISRTIGAGND